MFRLVGVVGAGQMGNGIAHVLAQHAYAVRLYDVAEAQVQKALKTIEQNLGRQAKKGIVEAGQIPGILRRITVAKAVSDLAACDLVIEAATEDEALKLDLFRHLDADLNAEAILATNTSSISITRLAAVTRRDPTIVSRVWPVAEAHLDEGLASWVAARASTRGPASSRTSRRPCSARSRTRAISA